MLVSTPLGGDSEEEGVGDWGLSHILSTAAWGVKLKKKNPLSWSENQ